jgi:hypothetical protein
MPRENDYEEKVLVRVDESDDELRKDLSNVENLNLSSANGVIASSLNGASLSSVSSYSDGVTNMNFGNTQSNVNLSQKNSLANQQRLNQLNTSIIGKTVNKVSNYQPLASRSEVYVLTENSLAETIADLKSAIEGFKEQKVGPDSRIPHIPDSWDGLRKWIQTLIECLKYSGKGSFGDPLQIDGDIAKIYLKLNSRLGLKDTPVTEVDSGSSSLRFVAV